MSRAFPQCHALDFQSYGRIRVMSRLARIVIPGIPHHVVQRGNRGQQTYFCQEDYETFLKMLETSCKTYGVDVWNFTLMPNHNHVIAVPSTVKSLSYAIGEAHENYAKMINARYDWRGHLWQERFRSTPMDAMHLYNAIRYVEQNPVRAGLCEKPTDYLWSSARIHQSDFPSWINTKVIKEMFPDWLGYLQEATSSDQLKNLRESTNSGRPLGDDQFLKMILDSTGRDLRKQKPGPKVPKPSEG
jgi:putative transposase